MQQFFTCNFLDFLMDLKVVNMNSFLYKQVWGSEFTFLQDTFLWNTCATKHKSILVGLEMKTERIETKRFCDETATLVPETIFSYFLFISRSCMTMVRPPDTIKVNSQVRWMWPTTSLPLQNSTQLKTPGIGELLFPADRTPRNGTKIMKLSRKQYKISLKYVSYFIMVDCFLFVSKQIIKKKHDQRSTHNLAATFATWSSLPDSSTVEICIEAGRFTSNWLFLYWFALQLTVDIIARFFAPVQTCSTKKQKNFQPLWWDFIGKLSTSFERQIVSHVCTPNCTNTARKNHRNHNR